MPKKHVFIMSLVVASLLVWCGDSKAPLKEDSNKTIKKPPQTLDTTPPVLSSTDKKFSTFVGLPLVLETITATDDVDGDVKVSKQGEVDFDTIGTYEIVYLAKDKAGNEASIKHTYEVKKSNKKPKPTPKVDTKAPMLSSSDKTFKTTTGNSLELEVVTATDDVDGDVSVKRSWEVDFTKSGTYEVKYSAKDKAGNEAIITHTYIVSDEINQAPVANVDNFTAKYGETKTLDVLANDTDENKTTLKITGVENEVWGRFEIVENKIKFTSEDGFSWEASATYTIEDEKGETSSAEIKVNVEEEEIVINNPPSKPTMTGETSVTEGESFDLRFNSTDPEWANLTYSYEWDLPEGTLFDNGRLTGEATEAGSWTFKVIANDWVKNSEELVVNWEVKEKINQAPKLNSVLVEADTLEDYGDNIYSIAETSNIPVTFTINAEDVEWDNLSIVVNGVVYEGQKSYTETLNLQLNEIKKFIIGVQDENWNQDENQNQTINLYWA